MIPAVQDAFETAMTHGCLESLRWMLQQDLIDSDIDIHHGSGMKLLNLVM